jgi:hypothetical protein
MREVGTQPGGHSSSWEKSVLATGGGAGTLSTADALTTRGCSTVLGTALTTESGGAGWLAGSGSKDGAAGLGMAEGRACTGGAAFAGCTAAGLAYLTEAASAGMTTGAGTGLSHFANACLRIAYSCHSRSLAPTVMMDSSNVRFVAAAAHPDRVAFKARINDRPQYTMKERPFMEEPR